LLDQHVLPLSLQTKLADQFFWVSVIMHDMPVDNGLSLTICSSPRTLVAQNELTGMHVTMLEDQQS